MPEPTKPLKVSEILEQFQAAMDAQEEAERVGATPAAAIKCQCPACTGQVVPKGKELGLPGFLVMGREFGRIVLHGCPAALQAAAVYDPLAGTLTITLTPGVSRWRRALAWLRRRVG